MKALLSIFVFLVTFLSREKQIKIIKLGISCFYSLLNFNLCSKLPKGQRPKSNHKFWKCNCLCFSLESRKTRFIFFNWVFVLIEGPAAREFLKLLGPQLTKNIFVRNIA